MFPVCVVRIIIFRNDRLVGLYFNEINGRGGGGGGYSILRCVIISIDTSVNMRSICVYRGGKNNKGGIKNF